MLSSLVASQASFHTSFQKVKNSVVKLQNSGAEGFRKRQYGQVIAVGQQDEEMKEKPAREE